jgi:hypothetical protein
MGSADIAEGTTNYFQCLPNSVWTWMKPLAVSRGGNDFVCNEFLRVR